MTDTYIVTNGGNDDFENALHGNIAAFSPEFHNQMIQAGSIVPQKKDEVAQVADMIRDTDADPTSYHLIVNPTLDCNFHCWYCYENHIKDSGMSEKIHSGIINFVRNQVAKNRTLRHFHLSFFGGEPLLRFNSTVRPLIQQIAAITSDAEISMSVHFTTNGYLITREMITFLASYDATFQITLDGGRENHNNTRFQKGAAPSFDVILGNVRKLTEAGLFVNLRINYTSKNIESTTEIVNEVAKWNSACKKMMVVDYQRVWQDRGDSLYDKTYDTVKKLHQLLVNSDIAPANNLVFDYVRNSCYADKDNEMLVNFNGDIFSCTARDFKNDNRLGHISEDGTVEYLESRMKQLKNARFQKPICHTCRIAPICGGGCRTKCLENAHHADCNLGYTSEDIDELILERFEERFMNR